MEINRIDKAYNIIIFVSLYDKKTDDEQQEFKLEY